MLYNCSRLSIALLTCFRADSTHIVSANPSASVSIVSISLDTVSICAMISLVFFVFIMLAIDCRVVVHVVSGIAVVGDLDAVTLREVTFNLCA